MIPVALCDVSKLQCIGFINLVPRTWIRGKFCFLHLLTKDKFRGRKQGHTGVMPWLSTRECEEEEKK